MSEIPAFYKCSIMFREFIESAGPATMEEAIEALSTMTNAATVRMGELGQGAAKDHLSDAWILIYDARKAVQP